MVSPLITTAELDQLLGRRDAVTVLDVRWRMGGPPGAEAHQAGHVPGAAYVDLERDLAAPAASPVDERGRHPLPDVESFGAAMRRAGVRTDRPVVVYDDWQGRAAARAWWLLRHHGHDQVRVLDGGWSAWVADGGAVQTGAVLVPPGDFEPGPGRLPVVDAQEATAVDVLVDAREPERYRGEHEPADPVAGRVPGAVNLPTSVNLRADGRFRSPVELAALYAVEGVTHDESVATYCGSGITATHDLLALELIGVTAALYAPSFSGWVSDPGRPVERG